MKKTEERVHRSLVDAEDVRLGLTVDDIASRTGLLPSIVRDDLAALVRRKLVVPSDTPRRWRMRFDEPPVGPATARERATALAAAISDLAALDRALEGLAAAFRAMGINAAAQAQPDYEACRARRQVAFDHLVDLLEENR